MIYVILKHATADRIGHGPRWLARARLAVYVLLRITANLRHISSTYGRARLWGNVQAAALSLGLWRVRPDGLRDAYLRAVERMGSA